MCTGEDKHEPRQPSFRFRFSFLMFMLIVTGSVLLFYWVSTWRAPVSAFWRAAADAPPTRLHHTRRIVERTLEKLRSEDDTMDVLRLGQQVGTTRDGHADVTLNALLVLPERLHNEYYDEFRQAWLDLLDETGCTVESDTPLSGHLWGFALAYTTDRRQGTLRVYCNAGGDQVHLYGPDGQVTVVPYHDDVLNVLVEVREACR